MRPSLTPLCVRSGALMAALLALGMTQKKESVEELSGVAAAILRHDADSLHSLRPGRHQ